MKSNSPIATIPPHLREHIAKQKYELYTAIDHASWRYIMRVSKAFFKKHAHQKYLSGLEQTGITTDRIPRISEMDKKLKRFGWRAVTVTGFIPPAAFLEFQSLSILPIACDMRRLEHLEYTPSPDIVHEAAGHAPIISDPSYAAYLHKFGEIARKAIFAKEDLEVYEAVKYLSDIKEDPSTTQEEIDLAYKRLEQARAKVSYASEATKLSRLGWWSTEYGLVKNKNDYKFYGAGLLSSVGESYNAVKGQVQKVPLTLDCVNTDFDITKPQPQLYYVESFKQLEGVIDELSKTMAFRIGGIKGLERAMIAGTVTTTELDSGLQISGVVAKFHKRNENELAYLQYSGPVQLAYQDAELKGHSAKYHAQGYGTPIGKIKSVGKSASELSVQEMEKLGLKKGKKSKLEFESGVVVEGVFYSKLSVKNQHLVFVFKDCKVTYQDKVLFDPSWGTFDMGCGEKIVSVFGGAADRAAYLKITQKNRSKMKTQTSNKTEENKKLIPLYNQVRQIREKVLRGDKLRPLSLAQIQILTRVTDSLDKNFPQDWLLRLEVLELLEGAAKKTQPANLANLKKSLRDRLNQLTRTSDTIETLIHRGLELI